MKTQMFLLIIIILLIAIPTDFKVSPNIVIAKEDFSTYVGYTGVLNNDIKEDKEPEKVQERCGGTRILKSGDGLISRPCPGCPDCEGLTDNSSKKCQCGCGKENCICGKSAASCLIKAETEAAPQVVVVKEEEKPVYFMYFFTAKWCGPCQTFKNTDKPILIKEKWVFDKELKNGVNVVEVDIDENPELYKKIMNSLPEKLQKNFKGTIPAFVIMYKGEVVALTEHYLRWENLRDFFNNTAKEVK